MQWTLAQISAAALPPTMVLRRVYETRFVNRLRPLVIPRGPRAHTFRLIMVCRCKKTVVPVVVGAPRGIKNLSHPTPRALQTQNATARGRTSPELQQPESRGRMRMACISIDR